MSVSLERLAPLWRWTLVGSLAPFWSRPLTYKKWAVFSLLPAALHSSRNALMPSLILVPRKVLKTRNNPNYVPSTAMQSSKTCPELSTQGVSRRPLHAGQCMSRGCPGRGALLPNGAWSIIHSAITLIEKLRFEVQCKF